MSNFATAPIPRVDIDQSLRSLRRNAERLTRLSENEWTDRLENCLAGIAACARQWVDASNSAKGVRPGTTEEAENWLTGPVAVTRCLRLMMVAGNEKERRRQLNLPNGPYLAAGSQFHVPLFPGRGLYDSLLFRGFGAEARLLPGVSLGELHNPPVRTQSPGVCLVLGAGNVSAIPLTDSLHQLWNVGRAVLLKLSPVNGYLQPFIEQAFEPLVSDGFLRVVQGDAAIGAYAAHHAEVDAVHITGSVQAHHRLVWGPSGDEPAHPQAKQAPLLKKPITSELGSVTPWIIAPGSYSQQQLAYQAENLAASIVNNASFNCIATKMVVSCRSWPQRKEFFDRVEAILSATPRRQAYYPGAAERFERFTGRLPEQFAIDGTLPWTLIRQASPEQNPLLFQEESFTCVCGETAIEADSAEAFLERAVDFVNHRLWGSLACTVVVPPDLYRWGRISGPLADAVAKLRYGTVAINHWSGVAYGLMNTPWGGFPGATIADPQSGIGWVHNPLQLEGVEKSIFFGPLRSWPKPPWFATHRAALPLARALFRLYHRPNWWRVVPVGCHAVRS